MIGQFLMSLGEKMKKICSEFENFPVCESDAAKMLCASIQTLRNWRCIKSGPAYLKIGRSVRYLPSDIEAFLQSHRIVP